MNRDFRFAPTIENHQFVSIDKIITYFLRVITGVHPEMVDFGSGQGRSLFATGGVVALRRGLQKDENAGLG